MIRGIIFSIFLAPQILWAATSRVVVIGDSQSYGEFGKSLLKKLREEKMFRTSYYARPGSTVDWWLNGSKAPGDWGSWNAPEGEQELRVPEALTTPRVDKLIVKHQPELVVVQLGGNMITQNDKEIREQTSLLITEIRASGSACLWIGPPPGDKRPEPRFSQLYSILKEETERNGCSFVDSRNIIKPAPTGGDGIHLDTMIGGADASKKWSTAVAESIAQSLEQTSSNGAPSTEKIRSLHK